MLRTASSGKFKRNRSSQTWVMSSVHPVPKTLYIQKTDFGKSSHWFLNLVISNLCPLVLLCCHCLVCPMWNSEEHCRQEYDTSHQKMSKWMNPWVMLFGNGVVRKDWLYVSSNRGSHFRECNSGCREATTRLYCFSTVHEKTSWPCWTIPYHSGFSQSWPITMESDGKLQNGEGKSQRLFICSSGVTTITLFSKASGVQCGHWAIWRVILLFPFCLQKNLVLPQLPE